MYFLLVTTQTLWKASQFLLQAGSPGRVWATQAATVTLVSSSTPLLGLLHSRLQLIFEVSGNLGVVPKVSANAGGTH
jgi:hypothetical protein